MKSLLAGVLLCVNLTCISQNAMRGNELLEVSYQADALYPNLSNKYDPLFAPAAPVITTDAARLEICSGQQTTLTATSDNEIYWYSSPPPAGKPIGKGNTFITPLLEQGYYVYYAVTHNEHSYSNFTSIDIVMVYPLPTITVVSSNATVCAGETVILSARGAKNMTWSTGESGREITTAPQLSTVYSVSGVNTAGCRNSVSFTQIVDECKLIQDATGISQSPEINAADINIYPNPNQGEFHVVLNII
ncbi:MAG: hypothetical protein JNL60_18435, partial [Bacteroidia bacterium]|nr:hypothetical protein [Bacteroidia bacterium]